MSLDSETSLFINFLSKIETAMENINLRLIKQILIGLTQAILVLSQGATLNYFIISNNPTKFEPYFNFLGDIICVFLFAGYQAVSYRFLITRESEDVVDIGFFNPRKNLSSCLSAVSWLLYSLLLILKIFLIFPSEWIEKLSTKEVAGPQLLKVAVALSTLIFLLQVEGYNWSKRGSPRYNYVNSECFRMGIEILDSVSLLSLLLPGESEPLGNLLSHLTIFFACCNFLFPLFILHNLYSVNIPKNYKFWSLIHTFFHILFSDVAFLTIRLYLWVNFNHNASIFLMKNILGILHSVREVFPTVLKLCKGERVPRKLRDEANDVDELKKINYST